MYSGTNTTFGKSLCRYTDETAVSKHKFTLSTMKKAKCTFYLTQV